MLIMSDKCRRCRFCYWSLDGAGDEIEYHCNKTIHFLDSLNCPYWAPKEDSEFDKYIRW